MYAHGEQRTIHFQGTGPGGQGTLTYDGPATYSADPARWEISQGSHLLFFWPTPEETLTVEPRIPFAPGDVVRLSDPTGCAVRLKRGDWLATWKELVLSDELVADALMSGWATWLVPGEQS